MTLVAHMTDLHLRPRGLACYRVSDTNMFAERALNSLRRLSPKADALVITGDITDKDDPREYSLARDLLDRIDIPVFVVPGNHDSSEGMLRELPSYVHTGEEAGGKICYSADIGDVRLIALDTHLPGEPGGLVGERQLAWLQSTLDKSSKPTLIAMHHPPALTGIVAMDGMGLKDADALEEILRPHTCVQRIACGHVHRPIIAEFAGVPMTLAPSTAHQVVLDLTDNPPAMFNQEPAAYFLHYHTQKTGMVSHLTYVEDFPGPFHFFADEGVSWPGDET